MSSVQRDRWDKIPSLRQTKNCLNIRNQHAPHSSRYILNVSYSQTINGATNINEERFNAKWLTTHMSYPHVLSPMLSLTHFKW